jgi:uncharacterized phage protein (TIGR01671 family)
MREFKFRLWSIEEKQFISPNILEVFDESGDLTAFKYIKTGKLNPLYMPVENYIIQQYTGLTDKNGKEIFEGDIIIDTQKQKYEIIFDENHARYDLKVCGENKLSQTSYFTQIYEKKHIEVIGNIFEHPELLN